MPNIQHKRGTRAALDALAASSGLVPWQVYAISDESRLALALTASTYQTFLKTGEAGGGGGGAGYYVGPTAPDPGVYPLWFNTTAGAFLVYVSGTWVEPGATLDPDDFVPRAGGVTMTGPLSVPAGATGSQVPRRSEVVGISGNESIGGVKTFTSKPKVPAGATGDEVPQAQEIFGNAQSWQTVTRTSGVTYTNSTGKPIIVQAYGQAANTSGYIRSTIDGNTASWSAYYAFATPLLGSSIVVPNGSTYTIEWANMSSLAVREYR